MAGGVEAAFGVGRDDIPYFLGEHWRDLRSDSTRGLWILPHYPVGRVDEGRLHGIGDDDFPALLEKRVFVAGDQRGAELLRLLEMGPSTLVHSVSDNHLEVL